MKKLLFLLLIVLASCTVNYEDAKVENPQKTTTIELQNTIIDSCAVLATDGKYVYVMKNNLVEYKLSPINDKYDIISIWAIGMLSILAVLAIFAFFAFITN
jgi:hypothetical protein